MSKFMNVLDDLSDSDSDGSPKEELHAPPEIKPSKKKAKIDLEDLEKCGYKSGPSVLFVPAPNKQSESCWEWGAGKAGDAAEDESFEERERNRFAANEGAEESAALGMKTAQQLAKLKEDEREEHRQLAQERRLTFQQKEKRKRDIGQAKGTKNYVEEEKRLARNFGVYSGFD